MNILDKLKNVKTAVDLAMVKPTTVIPKTKEEAIDYVKHNTGHYEKYTIDSKYRDGMYDDGDYQEFISSIDYLPEELKNDKEVVLAAVESDYRTYDKLSDVLKQDNDIIEAYNKRNIIENTVDIDNYGPTDEPVVDLDDEDVVDLDDENVIYITGLNPRQNEINNNEYIVFHGEDGRYYVCSGGVGLSHYQYKNLISELISNGTIPVSLGMLPSEPTMEMKQ